MDNERIRYIKYFIILIMFFVFFWSCSVVFISRSSNIEVDINTNLKSDSSRLFNMEDHEEDR